MFTVCDVVLINKTDVMPYFDFDLDRCREYIRQRNPKAIVFPICAKTGDGIETFADWLLQEVQTWKK
jgi:hydrogenase nickel incorporation protein HypB